jgi:hypothetical protein
MLMSNNPKGRVPRALPVGIYEILSKFEIPSAKFKMGID